LAVEDQAERLEGLAQAMGRFPSSPLEAEWVARSKTSCDELSVVDGALWWIQSDPELAGANRLVCLTTGENPVAVTPTGIKVGSWLHAYGGGAYAVSGAAVWFVSDDDSAVYLLDRVASAYRRMVPDGDGYVYGGLRASPQGVLAVREAEDGDQIVEITYAGQVRVLVEASGFLSSPTLCDGRVAYVAWDADQMPWDASRLCVAPYDAVAKPVMETLIAGGADESVVEPQWGPDGALYFLSDRTGWWNLYRWHADRTHPVFAVEHDCCAAPWEAGYRSYVFLPGGSIAVTLHDGFRVRLAHVDVDGQVRQIETDATSVKPYLAVLDTHLVILGANPTAAPRVQVLELTRHNPRLSSPCTGTEPGLIHTVSEARISATVVEGRTIRFLLRSAAGAGEGQVPLLVRAHPGPTDNVPLRLDWTAEFFISRGFAVADVAYRGSSGQGRSCRQVLYGHWGEYDVQDCAAVAEHLLAARVARPGAVFITGASAGGYTALQAARLPGPFTAATAVSAITNPERWATTAPRFQRPYAAMLAGPAGPVAAKDIAIPVLLIHGANDPVAPVADARQLAEDLDELGKEYRALFLDGGGHYLSDPRSREAALTAEADFYATFIGLQN
jgi:dipeptidyl aminopeptidase/acylaminoacyl peptidase